MTLFLRGLLHICNTPNWTRELKNSIAAKRIKRKILAVSGSIFFLTSLMKDKRSCPLAGCNCGPFWAFGGRRLDEAGTAGSPTIGSSPKGAMVCSLMERERRTAPASSCLSRIAPTRRRTAASLGKMDADELGSPPHLAAHALDRIGDRYEEFGAVFPAGAAVVPAYMARPSGIEAPGGPSAGRPSHRMNRELEFVVGRLFEPPGCAARANPQTFVSPQAPRLDKKGEYLEASDRNGPPPQLFGKWPGGRAMTESQAPRDDANAL